MAEEKKLQVRNLRISFRTNGGKVQAVRDISFDLYKGETLAIVGESGSGKSVTTKAILGIQAANAIYEGGEILYDGQDLLKIGEEDFYKLRGDKIAMIFQDPLSSLNPIMRIGKQLTEAMLLKGKARQRACKESFEEKIGVLEKNMISGKPGREAEIKEKCREFRKIEDVHTKLEQAYSDAHDAAEVADEKLRDMLSRLSVGSADGIREDVKTVCELGKTVYDEFVVTKKDEAAFRTALEEAGRMKEMTAEALNGPLSTMKEILERALSLEKPDFFALAYCRYKQIAVNEGMSIAEMNAFCAEKTDAGFMNEFTVMAQDGVRYAKDKYLKLRREALDALRMASSALSVSPLEEKSMHQTVDKVCAAVDASVNPMDIVKDSAACTFSVSLRDFEKTYMEGLRTNDGKERKYQHQMDKYNALVQKGKTPDWKVAAATTVDLEQVRQNMLRHVGYMTEHYEQMDKPVTDEQVHTGAVELISYLRENAAGMVHKVTKHMAKQHALKLMEEVGIPEPRKRYRSYPFEFSGGMRQRIVIAIALAANPDILICDEPTTALDVTIQAQILELINKLKRERNLSIIFITHDLGVVANMADRIAVMYAGKIVEYGLSEEVFYSPAHPYTWALLSSMPDLDTHEKLEAIPGTPPDMLYPPVGDAFAARNKYAMEIDYEQQPPEFEITPTHWAATWLLHPNAPHIDPPQIITDRIARMKEKNLARKRNTDADIMHGGDTNHD